jgi:hypothetical protein
MVRTRRGHVLVGATALSIMTLAALMLLLAPAAAESIDLYEFQEISSTVGADAVAVKGDGSEGVVLWSELNNTTRLYTNYVYTTSGSSLSERASYASQSWYWRTAAFDPSGNVCLLGGSRGNLYKYDGSTVTSVSFPYTYDFVDIEWHPTDHVAYLGVSTNRIYQFRSGSISLLGYTSSSVYDLDVRPDGGEIAVAAYSYLDLYNTSLDDWDSLSRPTDDTGNEYYYVYCVEYSLDGSYFIANWYSGRQYALLRYANDRWSAAGTLSNRVDVMLFENEGSFALLGSSNNLQSFKGGSVAPVGEWFNTGATGVNDLAYNTRDFYFLVGTPEGVFKFIRKPNVKPWLDRPIPDLEFLEDDPDGGDDLLDLTAYIRDDRSLSKLRFEFDLQQDPSLISGEVDGQYLDFKQVVEHWNGKMTFRLKVWDSGGDDVSGSADDLFNRTNMFNVTVRQVNDPVSFVKIGDKTVGVDDLTWFVDEGDWLNLTLETEDVDNFVELIQPPRFSFNRSLPTLRASADEMMLTFQPRNKDVGTIFLNLTVTDGLGSYDSADLTFHVSNVNNPPRLYGITDKTVLEDRWLNFTVSARDEDLDIGIETYLTFSTNVTDGVGDDDLPNFYFLVDETDTTRIKVSFLPTNEDVGVILVEFRVSDGFGTPGEWQDVRSMRITVVNTNDAPKLIEVDGVNTYGMVEYPFGATEDRELTISFLSQDDDMDPLVYYVDDSRFSLSQPGGGNTATVSFTPGNDDVGNLYVTVSVWDVYNTFDDLLLNISVQNVNDPPVITRFEAHDTVGVEQLEFTVHEDVLFTAPITVTDIDSDAISYSDSGGVFTFSLAGDTMSAIANFTPTQADVGEITTILQVDDGDGEQEMIVIILTVLNTNDPPSSVEITQLAFDDLTIPMRATQATDPEGDDLEYTWDFGDHSPTESGADLTQVSHDYPRSGTYTVTVTVSDGNGGTSVTALEVLVQSQGGDPAETEVEEGPVLLVVVLIVVFAAMVGVFLFLYWKLPRDESGDR